jgi:hypothetical protein
VTGRAGYRHHLTERREMDDYVHSIVVQLGKITNGRLLGYHTSDSRRSEAGYPDWTFAGPRGVMFRENKTATGKVRPAQLHWLEVFRLSGADVAVWTPADRYSGRITRELAWLAGLTDKRGQAGA